jgi:Kelch motif protein
VRAGLAIVLFAVAATASCGSGNATSSTGTTLAPASTAPASTAPVTVSNRGMSSTTVESASGPRQRTESPLPVAVQEAGAAVAGGRLTVVGGYDTARNSTDGVFVFDGSAWTRGPSLPIAVNHPGVAAVGADVYVAGGFIPGGATNRVFVRRGVAAHWSELASMRRVRGALSLVALAGRLYAIGGRDGSLQVAVPEVFDPRAGRWSDIAPMPAPRNHGAGYLDGGVVCVAGGRTPDTSAAIDCYDPGTASWSSRAGLPVGTSGAAAAAVDGTTIVAGGEPASETHLVAVVQTLTRATWSQTPMLVPRHGAAFTVYRGRMWACGGATAPGFQAVATCTSIGP